MIKEIWKGRGKGGGRGTQNTKGGGKGEEGAEGRSEEASTQEGLSGLVSSAAV